MTNYPSSKDFDRIFRDMFYNRTFETEERGSVSALPSDDVPKELRSFILDVKHCVAWDSVIGNEAAKLALRDAVAEATTKSDLYKAYGLCPPKGVLLWGPPGCGKTMLAKAVATELGSKNMLVINGPAVQSKWVGETERMLREIFTYANKVKRSSGKPLVVFFDEVDSLFSSRSGNFRVNDSAVNQILALLDGVNDNSAFVILATNSPESLDEALLRDGRISRKIEIKRPSQSECELIIEQALRGVPIDEFVDDLVFTAAEALFDPQFVILEGLKLQVKEGKSKTNGLNFCLEHIVNGAMAESVVSRAKLFAFQRDRASGELTGVRKADILFAVRQIYEENKSLPHEHALREFAEKEMKNA